MDFREELSGMVAENKQPNLVEISGIKDIEVSENLFPIKQRIEGLLNWRNDNYDLNPNCHELMALIGDFNNALAKEEKAEGFDRGSCNKLKDSFGVLYENVVDHALVGKGYANADSGLYQLFEGMKAGLESPSRINLETMEYLKVLAGVNYYQREELKGGNVAHPNPTEKTILNDSEEYTIPESLKELTEKVKGDINEPEKMFEKQYEI